MLRYPCLVLDHDDTVVQSTPTVNYPSFLETLKVLRPEMKMTLEQFLRYSYDPGFFALCTNICGMTEEELDFQVRCWRNYVRTHCPLPYPGMDEILHRQRAEGGLIFVASHSENENILRDYRKHFQMEPDGIYSWDLPPEKRKPSPYALEDIMNRYHLSPDQLLMVDDMKPGMDMAHACGVAFAAAGWSCGIPEIEKDLRQKSEFYLKTVDELRYLLFD